MSNGEVLEKRKTKRTLTLNIRKEQLKLLGHIMRKEGSENLILTEQIKVGGTEGSGAWPTWELVQMVDGIGIRRNSKKKNTKGNRREP